MAGGMPSTVACRIGLAVPKKTGRGLAKSMLTTKSLHQLRHPVPLPTKGLSTASWAWWVTAEEHAKVNRRRAKKWFHTGPKLFKQWVRVFFGIKADQKTGVRGNTTYSLLEETDQIVEDRLKK